jgi:Putative peptidoglycan binding domain
MKHCYRCGAEIRDGGYRRVVQTGRNRRVYHGTRRTSVSHSTSEGLRTLCADCDQLLDDLEARRAKEAAFWAKVELAMGCGAAVLLGIAYWSHSSKNQESAEIVHQDQPASPPSGQSPEPSETASITASPVAPAPEETIPRIVPPAPTFPLIGGDPSLLDPNFPPDVERVQDRLRSLGFSLNDPRGLWSKSTDLAVRRFRQSRGMRSDWRWDLSTQAALFAQANAVPGGGAVPAR